MVMKYKKLIKEFKKFRAMEDKCRSVYCTTCGGLVSVVMRNMTSEFEDDISDALSEMSIADLQDAGDWGSLFGSIDRDGLVSIFQREEKKIDVSNIRQLDRYLFDARTVMRNTPSYGKLLEQSVDIAIQTSDESLIETIAIILGKNILQHKELLALAVEKSKFNENILRVLYNTVREEIPEVRGYVGDGTTSGGWF
jgi:hypothetical protein